MKKCLFTLLGTTITTSLLAQGTISFKTSITHNPVYYTIDGEQNPAALALVPTSGDFGSGTVNYVIFSAPVGTPYPTGNTPGTIMPFSDAWTATPVGAVTYSSPGVISPGITITLPASSGAAGSQVELGVYAYTGVLQNPVLFGWSGELFAGGNTVTYNGNTTSIGALAWTQSTGNPSAIPARAPATLLTGTGGFGSIVLTDPTPEPSTIAIGGLGAAALLMFRRRK